MLVDGADAEKGVAGQVDGGAQDVVDRLLEVTVSARFLLTRVADAKRRERYRRERSIAVEMIPDIPEWFGSAGRRSGHCGVREDVVGDGKHWRAIVEVVAFESGV